MLGGLLRALGKRKAIVWLCGAATIMVAVALIAGMLVDVKSLHAVSLRTNGSVLPLGIPMKNAALS